MAPEKPLGCQGFKLICNKTLRMDLPNLSKHFGKWKLGKISLICNIQPRSLAARPRKVMVGRRSFSFGIRRIRPIFSGVCCEISRE